MSISNRFGIVLMVILFGISVGAPAYGEFDDGEFGDGEIEPAGSYCKYHCTFKRTNILPLMGHCEVRLTRDYCGSVGLDCDPEGALAECERIECSEAFKYRYVTQDCI